MVKLSHRLDFTMTPEDFKFIATTIKQRAGIVLAENKLYLVVTRLAPLSRKHSFANASAFVKALRKSPDSPMMDEVVDAMTTNETFFFRDKWPFETFRNDILPKVIKAKGNNKTIRIWSAAASTGQEAYSLAMTILENQSELAGCRFEIVGTDISTESLNRAKEGRYTQFEVQRGLPIPMLVKYFSKSDDFWFINQDVKSMVSFRPLNLLDDFQGMGRFDIVFCRNVMIYFDNPTKTGILNRIRQQMHDDGVLLLGGAETIIGITDKFRIIPGVRGVYAAEPASPVRK